MIEKKLSKAQVLKQLTNKLSIFEIPNLIYFVSNSYENDNEYIIQNIRKEFGSNPIIIRSSSLSEDGDNASSAGMYESVLNVNPNDNEALDAAVMKVIKSFKKHSLNSNEDQIIAQRMINESSMSGVIFTHDLNTGAPYYVINYDDESGLTDTVTSGEGKYSNRTLFVHRNSLSNLRSDRFIKLLKAVKELEEVMGSEFLDIEFAIGKDLTPYLFQVRSITTQPNWNRGVTRRIDSTLESVQNFVRERFQRVENIYGDSTILGQMPDWNPAEMIGRAPRRLASSLYQALITDDAWSQAREKMGYSIPKDQPLMVLLAGQPFIDTRLSFHSFIPKAIAPNVADKIVSHWVDKLKVSPELHDKVEFDVAITSYSFDIDEKIKHLIGDKLNLSEKNDFKLAHLEQTKANILGSHSGSVQNALEKISILKNNQKKHNNSNQDATISSLYSMISDCINYGTIPFSILARHGFIAKSILLSLERLGIMSKNEINLFQGSIETVASDLVDQMQSLQEGRITNSQFMSRFGHLRPGTYDIMSSRYDQMSEIFNGDIITLKKDKLRSFKPSKNQLDKIDQLLEKDSFRNFNSTDLFNYIRQSIIGREYGKFIFTRTVSDILEKIANFALKNGLSRDEISYIPLNEILKVGSRSLEFGVEENLRKVAEKEKEKHQVSVAVRLPQLVTDEASIHIVPFQVSFPNFITHKKVTAQCVVIESEISNLSLSEKVVVIEGADPGFDWIFTQNIAGLITKYGGANSHMAIRCAEFNIPAAIGCGEQSFEQLLKSNKVHLDCASGFISPLH